jgi:peptidoglycan/LPS O-acetylase OafA/YrhL
VSTPEARRALLSHAPALDGLRGLAACVVVAVHGIWIAASLGGAGRLSAALALLNANLAVETFFVLSGFVLAGSLSRQRSAAELPQFYRVFRIHPPYVAGVLFAWCASLLYGPLREGAGPAGRALARMPHEPGRVLRSLLFPGPADLLLPVGWTLEIEMVFSLLLPAMLWVALRAHWTGLLALCALPLAAGPDGLRVLDNAIDFGAGIALYLERERLSAWPAGVRPAGAVLGCAGALAIGSAPRLLGWPQLLDGAALRSTSSSSPPARPA